MNTIKPNEVINTSGKKAEYYGFKKDDLTNLDGITAAPNADMNRNERIESKIKAKFPSRWVFVFEDKNSTVMRIEWKEYYAEITMKTADLVPEKVSAMVDFYNLVVERLKKEEKMKKRTSNLIADLHNEIENPTA